MAPRPLVEDPLLGQNVGGYIVEAPLGEGSMGLVYRARHPVLKRNFAIKVLRPEVAANAKSSSHFLREAETLSGLKHPSIIDIVGFGPMKDGRQYMVMEYLLGKTLELELLEEGRLEPERALMICDEILDALSAAHSVGVIHRDLKPSNVFLEKVSGGREVVKLLDFGLSKQQPAAMAGTAPAAETTVAGTPEYVAPEQACGKAASPQSDLYSFGVMLFRMLTGSLPFKVDPDSPEDQQITGLLLKHVHQAPPTLHEGAPGVQFPEGLAELVADLLKKLPEERPSSAETARDRLRSEYRQLQQRATHVGPPPAAPPKKKLRSGLLLGLVLLVLVGAGAWWQAAPVEPLPTLPAAMVVAPAKEELPPAPPEVPQEEAAPLEDLEGLAALRKPKKQIQVMPLVPSCVPDADWKKRARADLNELVTRASRMTPELTLWAADREGPLSGAIEAAISERECGAVGRELAMFKQRVTRK